MYDEVNNWDDCIKYADYNVSTADDCENCPYAKNHGENCRNQCMEIHYSTNPVLAKMFEEQHGKIIREIHGDYGWCYKYEDGYEYNSGKK